MATNKNREMSQFCWFICLVSCVISVCGQQQTQQPPVEVLKWCTINASEQDKCEEMAQFALLQVPQFGRAAMTIQCIRAFNKAECMQYLDKNEADITTLDPGNVFVGGRYHSLLPIMQETYSNNQAFYYSVAVMKKFSLPDVRYLSDLKGLKACFPGVGIHGGWVQPIYVLMQARVMDIADCNNHVKSATNFFGPSCAVDSLSDIYNPLGDNSDHLCQLCASKVLGQRCTTHDPYAGYQGAFKCLVEAGEIAFVKHTTVAEMIATELFGTIKIDDFELFCIDGTRRNIREYRDCNWGQIPGDAVVTTSAKSVETRLAYQRFLTRLVELAGSKTPINPLQPVAPRPFDGGFPQQSIPIQREQIRPNFPDQTRSNFPDQSRGQFSDPNRGSFSPNQPIGNLPNQQRNLFPDQSGGGNSPNQQRGLFLDQSGGNQQRGLFLDQPGSGQRIGRQAGGFGGQRENFNNPRNPFTQRENLFNDPRGSFNDLDSLPIRPPQPFQLFLSAPRYGILSNLLFQDDTMALKTIPVDQQTYSGFLGRTLDAILGVRQCPVKFMTLCVTSPAELSKCIRMRTAMKAQLLQPEMKCYRSESNIGCMRAVQSGVADVTMLDAGDVYTAGLNFEMISILSEVYNLGKPEYYVVAVAKATDPETELIYLKNKNTCHTGIYHAAGWIIPLAHLLANERIRSYGCDSIQSAASFFTKACVPGAMSQEYLPPGISYPHMCDLCHGQSFRFCRRDHQEDYFGNTGAFRCLVEGGGHVAFVRHATVLENTDGKSREYWSRNQLSRDYELLCRDGQRAPVSDYARCNLGKVKANAMVARGGRGYNKTEIDAFINIFMYAQQFYGLKGDYLDFSLFTSEPPYNDVIFQDATQKLQIVPPSQRHYHKYLGPEFLRARQLVDCQAGAAGLQAGHLTAIVVLIFSVVNLFWRS